MSVSLTQDSDSVTWGQRFSVLQPGHWDIWPTQLAAQLKHLTLSKGTVTQLVSELKHHFCEEKNS